MYKTTAPNMKIGIQAIKTPRTPQIIDQIQAEEKGICILEVVINGIEQAGREMQREQNRQQQKIRGKNNTKSRQHVWEWIDNFLQTNLVALKATGFYIGGYAQRLGEFEKVKRIVISLYLLLVLMVYLKILFVK
ncbi:hypothetical protein [Peribacillus butanolivorans]|uniref:hypothetical protein n=1 Tax=Peribacillus butanolivorans TaxID=421767 RepID=UPI00366AB7B7